MKEKPKVNRQEFATDICVCVMPTIKIEISQAQNDTLSLIARRLYEEGFLKEPNIESLVLNTLQIVIKEYSSDPQSLVKYFKKRKSEDE